MASRLLRAYNSIPKSFINSFSASNVVTNTCKHQNMKYLKCFYPQVTPTRRLNFFAKYSADQLWKSATSVSNQGKARGRARAAKRVRDLNRGQQIGVGKINMLWPGLSGPIMRGATVVKQQKLPEDHEREAQLIKLRDSVSNRRVRRVHPLERGWSSAKMGGRSIGAPDPINDEVFENFDTKVIEHKVVSHMTGNMGRKKQFSCFVITGNKNGLCGIALGKSPDLKSVLRIAKNRAGQKLMYIERCNEHTVIHDFFTKFGSTRVYVKKKPEGYGLICHRAIKVACEMIGIKDIHCKVEGAMNYQHIIKAFLLGLLQQKSMQQLADEKKLHLVEFKKENLYYPKVVASPSTVRESSEISSTEILDFTQYVLQGRVILQKKKWPKFYTKYGTYRRFLRKAEYRRNQADVKIRLLAEYGYLRSFLADKYPECRQPKDWVGKKYEAT